MLDYQTVTFYRFRDEDFLEKYNVKILYIKYQILDPEMLPK